MRLAGRERPLSLLILKLLTLNAFRPISAQCGDGNNLLCVRKCCDVSESWNIPNGTCVPKDQEPHSQLSPWKPTFYKLSEDGDCVLQSEDFRRTSNYNDSISYEIGLPPLCMENSSAWNVLPSRNIPGEMGLGRFRMLMDGTVLINYSNGSWLPLPTDSYCVDEIQSDAKHKHLHAKVLLVCKEVYTVKGPKKPIPPEYAAILYTAAGILVFTIIIYMLLWDKHNLYERTVFFEVFSMLLMIVFLAVSHTIARDPSEGYYGSWKCIVLGMGSHFFFLSVFFWLFVINFEIWWNFRSLSINKRNSSNWLRLLCYLLVGYGGPGLMILIGVLLDWRFGLQNQEVDCTSIIVPNYGQLNCYISKRAQGPYLYYPIGFLLFLNLLFYSMTTYKMVQYQKQSQKMSRSRSNGNANPFIVFAKLFVVMGVSWIVDFVAWVIKPNVKGKIPLYWIIFDWVTLIQAIAIFVIFICKKEILNSLVEKYPSLRRIVCVCCKVPEEPSSQKDRISPKPRTISTSAEGKSRSSSNLNQMSLEVKKKMQGDEKFQIEPEPNQSDNEPKMEANDDPTNPEVTENQNDLTLSPSTLEVQVEPESRNTVETNETKC